MIPSRRRRSEPRAAAHPYESLDARSDVASRAVVHTQRVRRQGPDGGQADRRVPGQPIPRLLAERDPEGDRRRRSPGQRPDGQGVVQGPPRRPDPRLAPRAGRRRADARGHPAHGRLRRRRADGREQAGRHGHAPGQGPLERHPGQRASSSITTRSPPPAAPSGPGSSTASTATPPAC